MIRERWAEVARFCLAGGVSFLLDYGILYVSTEFAGINYFYSAAISFTVSVIANYWLCIWYVFTGASCQNRWQAILFVGSSVVGLILNQFCMWVLVEKLSFYYMLAKIFATMVVTVWNYTMKRKAVKE